MANVNSTSVADLIAVPQVIRNRGESQAELFCTKARIAVTTSDIALNNTIMLCPIEYNSRIHKIQLLNTALDTNGSKTLAAHLGVFKYDPKDGSITAISNNCYVAAGTQLQSAGNTDVAYVARTLDKLDYRVWQDAGLTASPNDGTIPLLGLTITTAAATAAAGNIAVIIEST